MPIALNMSLLRFRYGQVLQSEGEIPDGLYLIKSGQCKVALRRVVEQPVKRHKHTKYCVDENS